MIKTVILGLAALGIGLAAGDAALAQQKTTPVRFSLAFVPDGPHAPYVAARERGYFKEEGLEVSIDAGTGTGPAIARVAAGTHDFAVADLSGLIEFIARNPDSAPVAVFVVQDKSQQTVVAWKKAGINKPADLKGRVIAQTQGEAAAKMFPVFAQLNGFSVQDTQPKIADPRLRDILFFKREADAVIGFDASIWFSLKAQGVALEDLTFLSYADNGLDFYGQALIARRDFLQANPEAAKGFLRAAARGLRDATTDASGVASALLKIDPLINANLETERLQWVVKHQIATSRVAQNGFSNVDQARLGKQIETIAKSFDLKAPSVARIYDPSFLPAAVDRQLPKSASR